MITTDINKLMVKAKAAAAVCRDISAETKTLVFSASESDLLVTDDKGRKRKLEVVALNQICRFLKVPIQFCKVKQQLGDMRGLADVFNQHKKLVDSHDLTVRLRGKESIRAFFPGNAVLFDRVNLIRLFQGRLKKFPKLKWWASISGDELRLFGWHRVEQYGVLATTSETGALGISLKYGLITATTPVPTIIPDDEEGIIQSVGFRRMEKVEGDFLYRIKKNLVLMTSRARFKLTKEVSPRISKYDARKKSWGEFTFKGPLRRVLGLTGETVKVLEAARIAQGGKADPWKLILGDAHRCHADGQAAMGDKLQQAAGTLVFDPSVHKLLEK